jgi:hypothetical protein
MRKRSIAGYRTTRLLALWAAIAAIVVALAGGCDWHLKGRSTVTYDANGATSGNPPAAQSVTSGQSITLPNNHGLAKGDYWFDGWNTQSEGGGTRYASGDSFTVIDDVILYAQWRERAPDTYTVTYNENGATSGTVPAQVTNLAPGAAIIVADPAGLTKEDDNSEYRFTGWNTEPDGSGESYAAGDPLTVSGSITLYAQWQERAPGTYIVTYNGSGARAPEQAVAPAGTSITLASLPGGNVRTDEDAAGWTGEYAFAGWTRADSEETLLPGAPYWPEGDVTFYARWTVTTKYTTVTYNINGGSGTAPETVTVHADDKDAAELSQVVTLASGAGLERGGQWFYRWGTAQDGGTLYRTGDSFTVEGKTTLYAQYKTLIVTYYANGATSGTAPAQETLASGTTITVADPAATGLTKEDDNSEYGFAGWNTEPDGTGTSYAAEDRLTVEDDIALYANWVPHTEGTYLVTYNLNGATSGKAPDSVIVLHGEKIMLAPKPDGLERLNITDPSGFSGWFADFEFTGWNTSADGTGTPYQSDSESDWITADLSLYAQWQPTAVYTFVTYEANGGTGNVRPWPWKVRVDMTSSNPPAGTALVGRQMGETPTLDDGGTLSSGLERAEYDFYYWNSAADGTGTRYEVGLELPVTGRLTLYAEWRIPPSQVYKAGDPGPGGGIVFYDKGDYSNGWRYLEAAEEDITDEYHPDGKYAWGGYGLDCLDGMFTQHISNNHVGEMAGPGNTETLAACDHTTTVMVEVGEHWEPPMPDGWKQTDRVPPGHTLVKEYAEVVVAAHPAAQACADYEQGGFDDWYLPSFDELGMMFSEGLDQGHDITDPAERWFNARAALGFSTTEWDSHWSSTQYGEYSGPHLNEAYYQTAFKSNPMASTSGGQSKNNELLVRPVRRF